MPLLPSSVTQRQLQDAKTLILLTKPPALLDLKARTLNNSHSHTERHSPNLTMAKSARTLTKREKKTLREKQNSKRKKNKLAKADAERWEDRQNEHTELMQQIRDTKKANGSEGRKAARQLLRQAQAELRQEADRKLDVRASVANNIRAPESKDT